MMSLLWTHTTIEDMDLECPLQRLTCTALQAHADAFGDVNRYFNAGDEFDYFDFFLNCDTHSAGSGGGVAADVDCGSCDWNVDGTLIACTFGSPPSSRSGTYVWFLFQYPNYEQTR